MMRSQDRQGRRFACRIAVLLAALVLVMGLASLCTGCGQQEEQGSTQRQPATQEVTTAAPDETTASTETTAADAKKADAPDRNGVYDGRDEVALYIYTYGELPRNYITKQEAQKLGWSGGSLEPYAPGKCIGGGYFGNYEKRLPKDSYHECDINTLGAKSRGPERLVYSDEAIYYTGDHYETFRKLYDENGKIEDGK